MDWQHRLNNALQYIEANLEKKLDMEAVAAQACCSHFHFLRMFEVISGMTAGEYVRQRRLSQAALMLASGNERVIDVALRYGYDTPESFAKAFKRLFGVTPSEASRPGARLATFSPLSVAVVLKGNQTMHYRFIEQKTPIETVGVSIRVCKTNEQQAIDIPKFWQKNHEAGVIKTMCQQCGPMGLLGICSNWDAGSEEFDYCIAIEKPVDSSSVPPDWQTMTLQAATYVVFEARGPMPQAIVEIWQRAYNEWFPNSGYEHAGTPDFEVYPCFPASDPRGDCNSPQCYSEVWIPLKNAG